MTLFPDTPDNLWKQGDRWECIKEEVGPVVGPVLRIISWAVRVVFGGEKVYFCLAKGLPDLLNHLQFAFAQRPPTCVGGVCHDNFPGVDQPHGHALLHPPWVLPGGQGCYTGLIHKDNKGLTSYPENFLFRGHRKCIDSVHLNSSNQDCKALQRVVRLAEHISGSALPSLQDIYLKRCKSRAAKIIKDSTHPGNHLFCLLPSGKRFRSMMAHLRVGSPLSAGHLPQTLQKQSC